MRILLIFLIKGEEHPKNNGLEPIPWQNEYQNYQLFEFLGLELYIFADFEGL